MRFVTRCPSCGTSFRVVVDQLRIADGWVRCGWCQRVFDATQDLQPEGPAAPAGPPQGTGQGGAANPVPAAAPPLPAGKEGGAGDATTPSGLDAVSPASAGGPTAGRADAAQAEVPASFSSGSATPAAERCADGGLGVDADAHAAAAAPASAAAPLRGDPDEAPRPAEPAFVRAARRRARWRRPAVRAALAALALGLAVLLAAQVAWLMRASWLARWPALQPLAEAACARLGCTVGPRRDAEAVVVEGSVLLRRAPDRYSFHLVLRNRTDAEVAAPALELTLLDESEQPLVRRVWLPQEWPQPTAALAAGAEWPLQFELAFDHPQASRTSGYRVVLFHP